MLIAVELGYCLRKFEIYTKFMQKKETKYLPDCLQVNTWFSCYNALFKKW